MRQITGINLVLLVVERALMRVADPTLTDLDLQSALQVLSQPVSPSMVLPKLPPFCAFPSVPTPQRIPCAVVDCGHVVIGESLDTSIIAIRAAAIVSEHQGLQPYFVRTGPIFLDPSHHVQRLTEMGEQYGVPDYFVEDNLPRPPFAKMGRPLHILLQTYVERLLQLWTANSVQNGIVLFDGSLSPERNTPKQFWQRLQDIAASHGNTIIALSKDTTLSVDGCGLPYLLSDHPRETGYRRLPIDAPHSLGSIYAIRLSPLGPTLRLDLLAYDGKEHVALNRLYSSVRMRNGYPSLLVQAHAHTIFSIGALTILRAQLRSSVPISADSFPLHVSFGAFSKSRR